MSTIKNIPAVKDPLIKKLHAANENRGLWFYYLLKNAHEKGYDIEEIARRGIRAVGHSNRENHPDTTDLKTMVDSFMGDSVNRKLFDMEIVSETEDEVHIEFHYCPMCGQWIKTSDDQEFIEKICDIAMDVDRGLFDMYDCFEFELGKTICQGHDTCQVCIRKTK